jgi:hypothetical protein
MTVVRRAAPAFLIAGSFLLVTGCTSTPTTPSPSAAPPASTETAAPTHEPEASAELIVISTEAITVLAGDGTALDTFDYFQPTAEVTAGLTEYLGEPVDTPFPGANEAPPATYHEWGGLRLTDTVPAGQVPHYPEHWVYLTSSDANGVRVTAGDGIAVGDPVAPLEATAPAGEVKRWAATGTGVPMVSFRVDLVTLPPLADTTVQADGWQPSFGIMVVGDDTTGAITAVAAPSPNFGE